MKTYFSKQDLLKFFDCKGLFKLLTDNPELKKNESESDFYRMQMGVEIHNLAQKEFKNSKVVRYNSNIEVMLKETQELLMNNDVKTIFEATFIYNNLLIRSDVLVKNENSYDIYEIKTSTKVKPEHLLDLLIQKYVIDQNLNKEINYYNMFINGNYTVNSNERYFVKEKLLDGVNLGDVFNIENALNEMAIAKHTNKEQLKYFDLKPSCFDCEMSSICNPFINTPEHISNIPRMNKNKIVKLHQDNIDTVNDPRLLEHLTKLQYSTVSKHLADVEITNEAMILEKLNPEVNFGVLDFETIQFYKPTFKNVRPFQPFPVQASIKTNKNFILGSNDFIADCDLDQRKELIDFLCDNLKGLDVIYAWNDSFERSVINNLIEDVNYRVDELKAINSALTDLMDIVKDFYYHPSMNMSYSIKDVARAILGEKGLYTGKVANGDIAQISYLRLKNLEGKEKEELINELVSYCSKDTQNLMDIFFYLIDLAKARKNEFKAKSRKPVKPKRNVLTN